MSEKDALKERQLRRERKKAWVNSLPGEARMDYLELLCYGSGAFPLPVDALTWRLIIISCRGRV